MIEPAFFNWAFVTAIGGPSNGQQSFDSRQGTIRYLRSK
jgi:hypothetical protein